MRIAWMGPMPDLGGGAAGVGRQFLLEIARRGIQVDCYFAGQQSSIPEVMLAEPNLKFFCQSSSWQWDRWYSSTDYSAFLTGQLSNLRCEMKLAKRMTEEHRNNPYDMVVQFSHLEIHALKRYKSKLPPIVIYPTTQHMAELRYHLRETHLSKTSESFPTRWMVRLMLAFRAWTQKRHIRHANYIIGQSHSFAKSLRDDFKLPADSVPYIVNNPINIEQYTPGPSVPQYTADGRITFVFVSRISVRKGAEMIVELSNRLADMADKVRIMIIGDRTLWSDYREILKGMNPKVATHINGLRTPELVKLYNSSHALIMPSHFEPCGLVLEEALACGLPVVSSDKVGSSEAVDRTVCRVFPAGDMDALEKEVRQLIGEMDASSRPPMSAHARSEAERLFSSEVLGGTLASILKDIHRKIKSEPVGKNPQSASEKLAVNG